MRQLYTEWGKLIDSEHVLEEYPRPLLVRKSYINLNGYWDYCVTKKFQKPKKYTGRILVPFSPEAVLSGVSRQLLPDEYLWYRTCFQYNKGEEEESGRRLFLHFGAVDQACVLYVNGQMCMRHVGGYLPFSSDITEKVQKGKNEILVAVKDLSDTSYHARGKQKLKRGGMFYTAQSGIWQTVWMEEVPEDYIGKLETETDGKGVRIRIRSEACLPVEIRIRRPDLYDTHPDMMDPAHMGEGEELVYITGMSNEWIYAEIPELCLWTPETPYLYRFGVTMGKDVVESYFGIRCFAVEQDSRSIPRICLNGNAVFQNGVLDQGYWPDGLYTAPSDEALLFDIREMKKTGFNMVRKHLKIEPQRWYYHCDRMGMTVWQDMVNGGGTYRHWYVTYAATLLSWRRIRQTDQWTWLLGRKEKAGKQEFVREMKETVRLLKNHPCIAAWVIFNEGWGQFQTADLTEILKREDGTRLIDPASGWFDQGGGDIQSVHNYFFRLNVHPEKKRAVVLSEMGGYCLNIQGHTAMNSEYGYRKYTEKTKLNLAFRQLMENVEQLIPEGLCGSVYTQWSDIEEETNGIYTFDREVRKISEYAACLSGGFHKLEIKSERET